MGNIARKVATSVGAGVAVNPATNLAEEMRVVPWTLQMALEGKVFIAGHGLEEAATDGIITTLSEQTPTFMLMAPSSGTIVVPIWAEFRLMTEGGAAPDAYLSYVGVDRVATTASTTLDKLQIAGTATTSAAIAAKTISAVPAITSAQTVLLARRAAMVDNMISVESLTTLPSAFTMARDSAGLEYNFLSKFGGALVLYGGTSIMFHTKTATAVSAYGCTFVWAELPSSVYDHIA